MKFICLVLALVAVSNAGIREVKLSSGHIIQGTNSTGVIVIKKDMNYEIKWQEKFDSKNSLKVDFVHYFEDTGRQEIVKLANLCDNYEIGTVEFIIKYFVLTRLANSNTCPINKGVQKLNFPTTETMLYETEYCGPVDALFDVYRNNEKDPKVTPLLFSARFKGTMTGSNCLK